MQQMRLQILYLQLQFVFTNSIKDVCAFSRTSGSQFRHFGNTTCIVSYRSEGVNSQLQVQL